MQILDHEKPLAEWLKANHPDVLEDYEGHLGEDLSDVYFLDLRAWLRLGHFDVLVEYDFGCYSQGREALY